MSTSGPSNSHSSTKELFPFIRLADIHLPFPSLVQERNCLFIDASSSGSGTLSKVTTHLIFWFTLLPADDRDPSLFGFLIISFFRYDQKARIFVICLERNRLIFNNYFLK